MKDLVQFAIRIVEHGLGQTDSLDVPAAFQDLASEVYDVPECPEGFRANFGWETMIPAILVTGGLDSTVLYHYTKMELLEGTVPWAFYCGFQKGIVYADRELEALNNLGIDYKYIRIPMYLDPERFWSHIVPGRNLLFILSVAHQIQNGIIYFGTTDGEMPAVGGDKSHQFLRMVNKLLEPYPVTVAIPISHMTKTDLVRWWLENDLPAKQLQMTVSCFNESKVGHCGHCQACLRKAIAFANNGLELDTDVPVDEGCSEYIAKYKRAIQHPSATHYTKRRLDHLREGLERLEGATSWAVP